MQHGKLDLGEDIIKRLRNGLCLVKVWINNSSLDLEVVPRPNSCVEEGGPVNKFDKDHLRFFTKKSRLDMSHSIRHTVMAMLEDHLWVSKIKFSYWRNNNISYTVCNKLNLMFVISCVSGWWYQVKILSDHDLWDEEFLSKSLGFRRETQIMISPKLTVLCENWDSIQHIMELNTNLAACLNLKTSSKAF